MHGNKMRTQRMDSVPILCININITTDTMLKITRTQMQTLTLMLSVNGPLAIAFSHVLLVGVNEP